MTLNGDVLSRNCPFFALFWSTLQLALREWQVPTRWLDGPGLSSGSFYMIILFQWVLSTKGCQQKAQFSSSIPLKVILVPADTCFLSIFQLFIYSLIPHSNYELPHWLQVKKTGGCRGEGSLTCLACSCIVRVGTTRMDGRMGLFSRFKVL